MPLPEGRAPGKQDGTDGFEPPPAGGAQGIAEDRLFTAGTESPILLMGVEGSTDSGTYILVVNPSRGQWSGSAEAAADGSFNLPVNAAIGDTLEISEYLAGFRLHSVSFLVEAPSADAYAAQGRFDEYVDTNGTDPTAGDLATLGALAVYPPDATGLVAVTGTGTPGMLVLVANLSLGNATSALVGVDGSFVARLRASSGDELYVVAVEPAASNAGPAPLQVVVP